ncbi:MAG: hypothetical protein B6D39_10575 [Anaerolineae bacterium UTCFX2]|jgi:hypothetical protein|nr:toast rack family protein [Anaerolineales bacterium]OQY88883.1 MAG: hypothetical protein B6D39_10575 [Anaerolineae bacterium UTCFX2]
MSRLFIVLAISALALATLACGITINVPVDRIVTGPTQTDEIRVRFPDAKIAKLELSFGAGKLNLRPAEQGREYLVTGTAAYNVANFKPIITEKNESIRISTGNVELTGFPSLNSKIENRWDLQIGKGLLDLVINSGAYQGDIELGGLELRSLEITDGAADVRLRFSEPNPVEMERLLYQTGASNVQLFDLANANFKSLTFRSGAGDYRLDFSGTLQREAVVSIESGLSQVVVIVPKGTPAKLFSSGGLLKINASGGWKKQGGGYVLSGEGPGLTINVDMGAGNLELRTR